MKLLTYEIYEIYVFQVCYVCELSVGIDRQ